MILFLTHHKSEIIRSYLKLKNAQLKISYKFIKEHKPLGTCGGLRLLNTTLKIFCQQLRYSYKQ